MTVIILETPEFETYVSNSRVFLCSRTQRRRRTWPRWQRRMKTSACFHQAMWTIKSRILLLPFTSSTRFQKQRSISFAQPCAAKRLHFELESLSWRLARSQAAWYRELAVGMTTFMYDVKFCKSSSLNSFYSARSSITPKATNVSISELLTRISCERLSQRPGGCHFLCCVHGALDDVRLKGEEQTRCA